MARISYSRVSIMRHTDEGSYPQPFWVKHSHRLWDLRGVELSDYIRDNYVGFYLDRDLTGIYGCDDRMDVELR